MLGFSTLYLKTRPCNTGALCEIFSPLLNKKYNSGNKFTILDLFRLSQFWVQRGFLTCRVRIWRNFAQPLSHYSIFRVIRDLHWNEFLSILKVSWVSWKTFLRHFEMWGTLRTFKNWFFWVFWPILIVCSRYLMKFEEFLSTRVIWDWREIQIVSKKNLLWIFKDNKGKFSPGKVFSLGVRQRKRGLGDFWGETMLKK